MALLGPYSLGRGSIRIVTAREPLVSFAGKATNYSYDANNNLTQVALPTGATTKAVYGTVSNIPYLYVPTSTTDAQGNQTTYTYDGNGNTKTVTDALASQNQASATYNANGTLATATDFNGDTTSYSYDSKGNVTKITPPSPLGATTIVPDSLSRAQSVTDGNNQQTGYTYDPLDRVTKASYGDGSSVSSGYDADGNLTSMVDSTGTTTFGYDARNRESLKTLPGNTTVGYDYDPVSNLTDLTDSGGKVSYGYNQANELTSLTEPGTLGTTTFGYDANGRRTSTAYPGGVVQTATYDISGRLATIGAKTGNGTQLTSFSYSYQKPGGGDGMLVTSITDGVDLTTTAQQYDAANRLTSWVVTPGQDSTFPALNYQHQFDGDGNRTSINANGTVTTLGYNAANEWMTATSGGKTANYTYDGNGNELGNDSFGDPSKALKITYNAQDQTTSVTDTQGNVIPMTYTGPGQAERVSAGWVASNPLTPNGPATYAYGSGLLNAKDNAGTAYYTRDPGGTLVSQRLPNGDVYHYLMSGDGSVIKLVDPSGNVVATYHYCPTGNAAVPDSGPAAAGNPWRYKSMFYDPATDSYSADLIRIDPNSDNTSQPLFCLLPGLQIGFLCPRTSPGTTEAQAQADCPGTSPRAESLQQINGYALVIRGPEGGPGPCHVNAAAVWSGTKTDAWNWHLYWNGVTYWGRALGTEVPATAGVVQVFDPRAGQTALAVLQSLSDFVGVSPDGETLDFKAFVAPLTQKLLALRNYAQVLGP